MKDWRKKMAIKAIMRRHHPNPVCHYCGKALEWKRVSSQDPAHREGATIDHIIPRSRGGDHHTENMVVACWPCNQDKGNKTRPRRIEDA